MKRSKAAIAKQKATWEAKRSLAARRKADVDEIIRTQGDFAPTGEIPPPPVQYTQPLIHTIIILDGFDAKVHRVGENKLLLVRAILEL